MTRKTRKITRRRTRIKKKKTISPVVRQAPAYQAPTTIVTVRLLPDQRTSARKARQLAGVIDLIPGERKKRPPFIGERTRRADDEKQAAIDLANDAYGIHAEDGEP